MFFHCGEKVECSERTHTDTGRTCAVLTERRQARDPTHDLLAVRNNSDINYCTAVLQFCQSILDHFEGTVHFPLGFVNCSIYQARLCFVVLIISSLNFNDFSGGEVAILGLFPIQAASRGCTCHRKKKLFRNLLKLFHCIAELDSDRAQTHSTKTSYRIFSAGKRPTQFLAIMTRHVIKVIETTGARK